MRQKSISWRRTASIGVSVKLRNDYADYDYLDKLNEDEMMFLRAFHREYVNADFKHPYEKIYTSKEEKRVIYGLNNSRNRDLYNILKQTFMLATGNCIKKYRNEDGVLVFYQEWL